MENIKAHLCYFIGFGELEIAVKRDEDTECWRIPGAAPTIHLQINML